MAQENFKDKVIVVTGGNGGLGLGIAKEFAALDGIVIITGRDQLKLQKAVAELGPKSEGIVADASDIEQMNDLLKNIKSKYGKLDVLVANAGIGEHAPLGKITEEQFDKTIGTNLKGVLFAIQSAVPLMESGGSIVIIGSTGSVAPPAGMSVYGAGKAALRSLVRGLILDIKGSGIRINILSPGTIDTESLRQAFSKASGPDKVDATIRSVKERSPLGRIGTPAEVGKAVVFLASDSSSFIHGVELFADGGLTQV